uniref:RRM domain-containing protein n=1 Tax=Kalanchoe fedtschenkoi TaxID=63787 RepID=A0A7N0VBX2_KALFE
MLCFGFGFCFNRDGKSRQFAFIGYRTDLEAQEALKYFDKSFLDASRIVCEIAHKVGDPNIPRPWSRYSVKTEDKSANVDDSADAGILVSADHKGKGKKDRKKNENENEDPKLQEFLQVMQPRSKMKLWDDDAAETIPSDWNGRNDTNKASKKKTVEKKQVASDDTAGETQDAVSEGKALKTTKKIVYDDKVSDADYFKSRMKQEWSDSESNDDDTSASDGSAEENTGGVEDSSKSIEQLETYDGVGEGQSEHLNGGVSELEKLQPVKDDEEDEVLETDRLFVRNLPYTATEDELEEYFSKVGKLSQVHLVLDKQTKRSKGFAYIQYSAPQFAARALEELDNSVFQGRLLHVLPAKQKILPDKEESNTNRVKNFKEKREEERKASEASGNTKAWNTFFMRPDTVIENIARRFGVSKSAILDPESDDVAVRVALGETQVIAETKKALKNAGINIAALEEVASGKYEGVKRSNHVILVKNLPYGSSEGELAKMFGKFGSLDKIVLPPTKTVGVVIYLEPSDARAAFKGLAYKRYKDAPLYLEWAPADVLSGTVSPKDGDIDSTVIIEHDVKKQLVEDESSYADIDPDRVESRSLFVKNLNFKTTEESLREHFASNVKNGKILSVKIKKHVKNGKTLSMGFGFIEFDSVDTATRTCKDLQGTVLDGHALNLQLCHGKKDEKAPGRTEKDKSSTKIIVRNVAFEATEKDLRQLFSPFGQIKRLRLPKKFENHRGFAFIEFLTKQEAQNALQALSSTHLYGRRLVLERAKEGESLEELRERTAAQFTNAQEGFQNQAKLSKKRKHTDVFEEGDMEIN